MFCSKEQVLHSFGKKEITSCYWIYIKNQIFGLPKYRKCLKKWYEISDISPQCNWLKLTSSLIVSSIWFFTNQFRKPNRTFGQWNVLGLLKCHQTFSWLISTLSFLRPMLHFWWRIQRWRNTARFTQKEKINRKQA